MEHVTTNYAVVSPWGGEIADKIHPFPKDSMNLYGVGGMLSVNLWRVIVPSHVPALEVPVQPE